MYVYFLHVKYLIKNNKTRELNYVVFFIYISFIWFILSLLLLFITILLSFDCSDEEMSPFAGQIIIK